MSREKQIEEMAEIIAKADDTCRAKTIAEALYNAGYRKQSEVVKEFVEKLYAEFRMYGVTDKFNKEMFLTAVDKVAEEMKGGAE